MINSIKTWIQIKKWSIQYFKQDNQTEEDFFEHNSWLKKQMKQLLILIVQYVKITR